MSCRNQPVIEEFDDDTDLPLPSRPLPNTGDKGAILQSIDSDDEDMSEPGEDVFARGWPKHPGPASPSNVGNPFGAAQQQPGAPLVTDLTPYKKYVRWFDRVFVTLTILFTKHLKHNIAHEDGPAFIPSTLMLSAHSQLALVVSQEKNQYGGH